MGSSLHGFGPTDNPVLWHSCWVRPVLGSSLLGCWVVGSSLSGFGPVVLPLSSCCCSSCFRCWVRPNAGFVPLVFPAAGRGGSSPAIDQSSRTSPCLVYGFVPVWVRPYCQFRAALLLLLVLLVGSSLPGFGPMSSWCRRLPPLGGVLPFPNFAGSTIQSYTRFISSLSGINVSSLFLTLALLPKTGLSPRAFV